MSLAFSKDFLQALDSLKQLFTCGVCKEWLKNPVTLARCLHLVCAAHFKDLKTCPDCGAELKGTKTYTDDELTVSVESTKTIANIVRNFTTCKSHTKIAETVPLSVPCKGTETCQSKQNTATAVQSRNEEAANNEYMKSQSARSMRSASKRKINENTPTIVKRRVNENSLPIVPQNENRKDKSITTATSKKRKSLENVPQNENAKRKSISNSMPSASAIQKNENAKIKSTHTPTKQVLKEDLNISTKSNTSISTKSLEKRNRKGETPLHIACRLGKIDDIIELLDQGANINTKDNAGWTPLHEVVQNGRLDLVKLLLQHNALVNVPGLNNETPLHEAVHYGHKDIAEELVKNGADLNARNCKGESPIELAEGKIKETLQNAADNIIQTQSNNVSQILTLQTELDFDDIRVYCISAFRTCLNKLKFLVKHHSNVHIEHKLTKNVTHLIVDTENGVCTSTADVLQGIVYGIWVLSSQWLTDSNEKKLQPFDKYEVKGVSTRFNNGPKNARFNKYKQLPGLFNGCHFYFHNLTSNYEISKHLVVTKALLTKLVTDAGGVVLRRVPNPESIPESEDLVPYHAKRDGNLVKCSHYIIFKDMYEPMYNMKHLKALPIGWLIECLEKYELCEPWSP